MKDVTDADKAHAKKVYKVQNIMKYMFKAIYYC